MLPVSAIKAQYRYFTVEIGLSAIKLAAGSSDKGDRSIFSIFLHGVKTPTLIEHQLCLPGRAAVV
ncbi:MAG: hypothetical protein ACJAWL_000339 [Motiliproteus sp.]